MSRTHARIWIFVSFLATVVVAVLILTHSYYQRQIYSETYHALSIKLLVLYSVPLSIALAGIIAKHTNRDRTAVVPGHVATAALTVTLLWNAAIIARFVIFLVAEDDPIADVETYIDIVTPYTGFLVAGTLTYFFGKT